MTTLPSLASAPWLRDPALARIFAILASAGGESRVAGGAVRDALLGEPIADIDIATTLEPEAVMAAGAAAGLAVHPTGLAHGTIMLVAGGKPFEVTTLRIDTEPDGRRATVVFTGDWEADARRRDFTMNALYCDAAGKLCDPTGGYPDILQRRIRFVGEAVDRIAEDYLRILRFFRFHARYGRGAPEAAGLAACIAMKDGLRNLSAERIRQELLKLLVAPRAAATLAVMLRAGILPVILPGANDLKLFRRIARIDQAQGFAADATLRLATLVAEPRALRARLRLTNDECERCAALARHLPPSPALREDEQRAVLYRMRPDTWRDAVRLAWTRSRAAADDLGWRALHDLPERWPVPALPLDGRDLLAAGIPAGPRIGQILTTLEDWWIASGFSASRAALLARLPEGD